MTSKERTDVEKIIRELAASPEANERQKFRLTSGDFLFSDRQYWVLYAILNEYTIAIMGVGTN